jgi:hypothetical protein
MQIKTDEETDEFVITTENRKETVSDLHTQSFYNTLQSVQYINAKSNDSIKRLQQIVLFLPSYIMDRKNSNEMRRAYIERVREIQNQDLDVDEEHREILFAIYELVDECFEKCDKFLGFRERQEVMRIPKPEKLHSVDPTVLDSFAHPPIQPQQSSQNTQGDDVEKDDTTPPTKDEKTAREERLRKEKEATAELLELGLDLNDDETQDEGVEK